MPGRYLVDVAVNRLARALDAGQQPAQPVEVNDGPDVRVGEQGLGLGAEQHSTAGGVVVQRLDAQPVPDEKQALQAHVPQREGEHAGQPGGQAGAPFLVTAQHDLGVACRPEPVPPTAQFLAQPPVVVDLAAVAQHHGRLILVPVPAGDHRLAAPVWVDHSQPPVAENGMAVGP